MSTHCPLVRTATAAICLVALFATTEALAQTGPYGTAPGYAAYPYPTAANPAAAYPTAVYPTTGYQTPVYQVPSGYGMNPAAGYYPAPRVARVAPETVAPPQPDANGANAYPAPYNDANANQPIGNGFAAPGEVANTAGCGGAGAGCCDSGERCGLLGYGIGSLFAMGGGCGLGQGCGLGGCVGARGAGCGLGCGAGCDGGCPQWFGGIYGLYMKRDHDNQIWTSWDGADPASAILGSHDAGFNWQSGTELRFGRTFGCGNLAWEVVFWGLYSDTDFHEINAAATVGGLNSSIDFDGLEYDNGGGIFPVNDYFDNAQNHRVGSFYEVQNIEINLIKFPIASCVGPCGVSCGYGAGAYPSAVGGFGGRGFGGMYGTPAANAACSPCAPRFSIVGIAGVRFMRTDEWFDFDTDLTDTTWGNSPDELFYDVDVENHLIGFQLGCAANYQVTQGVSLYCDSKFGIYGNHITHRSLIWGDGGFPTVVAGLPYAGENFDIESTKNDVAFLGELRVGGSWSLRRDCGGTPTWRLFGGYRAVGMSGVALAVNQLPAYFSDTHGVANIQSNGHTILHGLEAGIEMTY